MKGAPMRTNIEIDEKLMRQAMKAAGKKTKRETVEAALEMLVRMRKQESMRDLFGKLHWEGDLEKMRLDK